MSNLVVRRLRVAELAGLELLLGDTGAYLEDEEAGQCESGHKRPPADTSRVACRASEKLVARIPHGALDVI